MTTLEQSERALVGCMVERSDLVSEVELSWFDDKRLAFIAGKTKDLVAAGKPVDSGTVSHACADATLAALVLDCAAQCHSAANFTYWRDIVLLNAEKTRLSRAAKEFIVALVEANGDLPVYIATLENALAKPRAGTKGTMGPQAVASALTDHLEVRFNLVGKRSGLVTGFPTLDRILDGLQFGELTVLGARPRMGKTALACNIVERVCLRDQVPTLFLSLEMGAAALSRRMLSSWSGIALADLRSGRLSERDLPKIAEFDKVLKGSPFYVREAFGGMGSAEASALIIRGAARKGVKFVVLDYLQKLKADRKQEKRTYEIAECSGAMVDAARRSGVALLALAQLNREPDKDKGRRPRLNDLADSGQVERDADTVLLLHRDWLKDVHNGEILVAKQRDGETGNVELYFEGETCRFREMMKEPVYEQCHND